jgi:excisionase family DNA binding protein
MKNEADELLSTTQAGARLGVTRQRVLELITEDRLAAIKVGRAYVVRAGDVATLERGTVGRPKTANAATKRATSPVKPRSIPRKRGGKK